MSKSGICSRRKSLEFIKQGLVKVNSIVIFEPSTQVDPNKDKVEFKNRQIKLKEFNYILLNKPKGVVATKEDKFAYRKVIDLLPEKFRHLNPCGRLDKDSSGLLLLTNDGELLYRLTHPKFEIKKTYVVKAKGEISQANKAVLEKGVMIEGGKTKPALVKLISLKSNLTEALIEIKEGKKRQIRLMFEAINHPVVELKRIKEGILSLGDLKIGQWRFLTHREIQDLYREIGLTK